MSLLLVLVLAAVLAAAFRVAQGAASGSETAVDRRAEVLDLWRRREQQRARRRELARRRRLPPLPAADAPPAGLPPLVPSPRTMRVEAARGIREIEDWLGDQAAA